MNNKNGNVSGLLEKKRTNTYTNTHDLYVYGVDFDIN